MARQHQRVNTDDIEEVVDTALSDMNRDHPNRSIRVNQILTDMVTIKTTMLERVRASEAEMKTRIGGEGIRDIHG